MRPPWALYAGEDHMTELNCKARLEENYRGRMADIRKLWAMYRKDCEASDPDLGNWNEYGLCLDYVAPGTFNGQKRGYIRYQLSTGGPGDEFRFYLDENLELTRIEYWFLDWFDGACRKLRSGEDFRLLCDIYQDWKDCGTIEDLIEKDAWR